MKGTETKKYYFNYCRCATYVENAIVKEFVLRLMPLLLQM